MVARDGLDGCGLLGSDYWEDLVWRKRHGKCGTRNLVFVLCVVVDSPMIIRCSRTKALLQRFIDKALLAMHSRFASLCASLLQNCVDIYIPTKSADESG